MVSNRKLMVTVLVVAVIAVAAVMLVNKPYDRFQWSDSVFAQDSAYLYGAEPSCNVEIPAGAVVGAFVSDTLLYAEPDLSSGIGLSIGHTAAEPKTAWVIGMDASGQFYQIAWACNYLWVPVSSIGPNYDEVWDGTPLPTDIVD